MDPALHRSVVPMLKAFLLTAKVDIYETVPQPYCLSEP